MLRQSLQQKLQQKMSPVQLQMIKLLEVPTAQLDERIKEELENNPVLDIDNELSLDDSEGETSEVEQGDTSIEDYLRIENDVPSYKLQDFNRVTGGDADVVTNTMSRLEEGVSLSQFLREQMGESNFSERDSKIAQYIIGNIDEDGYLRRSIEDISDDVSFVLNEDVSESEIKAVLSVIQGFEPLGVAASSLRECLLIQLKAKDLTDPIVKMAYDVIDLCFDEFTKKHYDKIVKRLKLEYEEDLREALEEILRLNPKPGTAFSNTLVGTARYIVPDFIVDYDDNKVVFRLNRRNLPSLKINNSYVDMLDEYAHNKSNQTTDQKDAVLFVKQKLDTARCFIEAIRQRYETLNNVMKAIIDFQGDYFVDGDSAKLKPMKLKDIAAIVGLDASTVSRVTSSKYCQTPFGTFPLKHFFSEAVQNMDGEDVSTRAIKDIIKDSIESEDKHAPYTDDKLTEILLEKQYNVARRTVAKYREQMGIPVARLRKEL